MQKALADQLVQRILISLSVPAHEAVAEKRPRQQQRRGARLEPNMKERSLSAHSLRSPEYSLSE
jgi:hypothetical protein